MSQPRQPAAHLIGALSAPAAPPHAPRDTAGPPPGAGLTSTPAPPAGRASRAVLIGGAGLLLALAGQLLLDRRDTLGLAPGGLLLGVGAVAVAVALAGQTTFFASRFARLSGPTERLGRWRARLLIAAVLLGGVAIPGFVRLAQTGGHGERAALAWPLWLVAVALFALAPVLRRPRRPAPAGREAGPARPPAPGPRPARFPLRLSRVTFAWLAILAAAAFFRFYQLDSVPRGLWADEAIAGLQAEQILREGWRPLFIGGANGEPALYLYGLAALIRLFGPTILAIRLPMALAGTVAVGALGWLALPVYGRRVALAAAALLAAMTWQINFSRIGFNAAWSLPVDLLAAGCLLRALATGRLRWYAWAGLLAGCGFQLYYISRAWLGLLVVLLGYRLLTERGLARRARGGLALAGLGLLLGAAPVLVYAAVEPADYLARASSVAATQAVEQAGSLAPLVQNLAAHLAMWNVAGDPNGRHNLPGSRLLDPLTAALLPAGLALALAGAWVRRRGRVLAWPALFPAVGLVLLLAGGVLSAPDESPQALRTLGDSSLVALLAALPLAGLWGALAGGAGRAAGRPARPLLQPGSHGRLLGAAVVAGVLVLVGAANYRRYFLVQEPNPDVYKAFSTPATLVAERAAAHGPGTDDFVALGLYEQATIEYLAGGRIGTPFSTLAQVPLPPGAPGRPAMLFLDTRNSAALSWLQAVYPHAAVESVAGPEGGNALFFVISVPAADRAAPYHVARTLQDPAGARQDSSETAGIDTDWARALPAGLTWPLAATWHGTLHPPVSGVYHLAVEHTAGPAAAVRLELAGRPLAPAGGDVPLIAGRYPFTLSVTVQAPAGVTRLLWSPPPAAPGAAPVASAVITPAMLLAPEWAAHGVTARYWDGTAPQGPAGLVREEPSPSWFFFYTPFGVGPFVGDWRGTLLAPAAGRYTFDVDIGGRPALWLDGQPVAWEPAGRSLLNVPLFTAASTLTAGPHSFRFEDRAPWWREPCILFWTPPGGARQVIPAGAFLPELWPP